MKSVYELAKSEIGTVEWGNGRNPKVISYFRDSGNENVKDDGIAWCAAFVGAMLKRAGINNTGSLAARSYLKWGVPIFREDAQKGDIVVFERSDSKWQGHVAFFVKDNGSTITVLGGNQSNSVSERDYPSGLLLGIRRQSGLIIPSRIGADAVTSANLEKDVKMLKGKKTYITAGVTIIGAIASYLVGDADLANTIQLVVTSLLAATIRNGLSAK